MCGFSAAWRVGVISRVGTLFPGSWVSEVLLIIKGGLSMVFIDSIRTGSIGRKKLCGWCVCVCVVCVVCGWSVCGCVV